MKYISLEVMKIELVLSCIDTPANVHSMASIVADITTQRHFPFVLLYCPYCLQMVTIVTDVRVAHHLVLLAHISRISQVSLFLIYRHGVALEATWAIFTNIVTHC